MGRGVVVAILAIDCRRVAYDQRRRDELSQASLGVVEQGICVEPSCRVVEDNIVEEVNVASVGVIEAFAAIHQGAVVDGVAPVEIGGRRVVAIIAEQVSFEDSMAVDKGHSVAPDVGDAGGAVVDGSRTEEGGGVGDADSHIAVCDEDIVFGIEGGAIGIEGHAIMVSFHIAVEKPNIGVVAVAAAHIGLVLDNPLGTEW